MYYLLIFIILLIQQQPISTLFPYTTLFRSRNMNKEPSTAQKMIGDFAPKLADLTDEVLRSEEHTSELQSVDISYAVFCLKKKILNSILLSHDLRLSILLLLNMEQRLYFHLT